MIGMVLALALATALGGLLSLVALCFVGARSIEARRRQRALQLAINKRLRRREQNYQAFETYREQRYLFEQGQAAEPTRPFGGVGDIERQTIIHNDFRAEHREIMGYDEHEEPELKDLDLVTDIRAELQLPALLGAIGVLLSTVASVMSLYVE